MKLKIVAVRDRAIDAYNNPFYVAALGQALRSFGDEVNNRESAINKHPEDHDLYELGEYDTDNGKFETHEPRQIAIGKDQLKST